MKIEDVIPQRTELKLSSTEKTLVLRPVSLEDEFWMQKEFGDDLQKVFNELRMRDVCRIAYRLLEDKSDFVEQEVTLVNEEGKKVTEKRGGVELLFCMVLGMGDRLTLVRSLVHAMGVSRPMLDKLEAEEEKKRLKAKAIGKSFSTSSRRNTAGKQNTSSRARSAKSSGDAEQL